VAAAELEETPNAAEVGQDPSLNLRAYALRLICVPSVVQNSAGVGVLAGHDRRVTNPTIRSWRGRRSHGSDEEDVTAVSCSPRVLRDHAIIALVDALDGTSIAYANK
jgi:hypothetical protein